MKILGCKLLFTQSSDRLNCHFHFWCDRSWLIESALAFAQRSAGKLTVGVASRREGIVTIS
ncbi:hypothetical protein [Nostoc sp.]|uniref:hypothetical protein n=1 Tax=Nostoc sp. TaxID=1180 RepID=UPI002FF6A73D